ncbi:MAG: endonuclease III [Thermoprotei archaeon]|nr:MAG: endonuclease III [Thermoprotei archaeon]RLF25873.1 MAG: endonuclease III [Thermoprotei archaeon]
MERPLKLIIEYMMGHVGDEVKDRLKRLRSADPFELLVGTILSQNSSDVNAKRAFDNLKNKVPLKAEYIARMDEDTLAEVIKPSGMQRIKARRLIDVSKEILRRYGGSLDWVRKWAFDKARRELLSLPGIGFKTADILLVFYARRKVLPVDTHISRIAVRLGYARSRTDYEQIRKSLEAELGDYDLGLAHLLLLEFGRNICRARSPLCSQCPVRDFCPSRTLS